MMRSVFPLIDGFLLRAFRFRTRRFLRMEDFPGLVPPLPEGGCGCLYLHIPFCPALCPFCSFHRVQHCHLLAQRYFHSLREEARRYYKAGFRFTSAYFGGGTPTTEPVELVETIQLIRRLFAVKQISVESNLKDLVLEILLPLCTVLDDTLYVSRVTPQACETRIAEGLTGITVQSRLSECDQMQSSLEVKMF